MLKELHLHYDFNEAYLMTLLDPEGKNHNIKAFRQLKNQKKVIAI